MAKHRIDIRTKKWWWSPFIWMVDVVLKGVWVLYRINKDEGESMPLLPFRKDVVNTIFWNIGQIILELSRNSKYPIGCLLWWHKMLPGAIWTQTYSEPLQASKMECFADTVNGWKLLTDEYAFAEKQGWCKVCKKNLLDAST